MVNKELLDILACPSCKGDLEYNEAQQTLTCSAKHCPKCGMPVDENSTCTDKECGATSTEFVALEYEIKEDIPIMLINEAKKPLLS